MRYERRHPAIVPSGSRLAWLIMDSAHTTTYTRKILDPKTQKRIEEVFTQMCGVCPIQPSFRNATDGGLAER